MKRLKVFMDRFLGRKIVVTHSRKFPKDSPRTRFRLPYLSYMDPSGKFEVAIYVNHMGPSYANILLEKYFALDYRVAAICKFVIHWARIKRLLGPSKYYLSSYALILMVIFFLQIQSPPVIDSIQVYAKKAFGRTCSSTIPSFKSMLTRVPDKDEWMHYRVGNVVNDTIDLSFTQVDTKILNHDLEYPKNMETIGEILIKFFYYFAIDYPKLVLSGEPRKLSIRNKRYLPLAKGEEAFAFCIEDPLVNYMNPGYSVLINTIQYRRIIRELKTAYIALSSDQLSYFKTPYKC